MIAHQLPVQEDLFFSLSTPIIGKLLDHIAPHFFSCFFKYERYRACLLIRKKFHRKNNRSEEQKVKENQENDVSPRSIESKDTFFSPTRSKLCCHHQNSESKEIRFYPALNMRTLVIFKPQIFPKMYRRYITSGSKIRTTGVTSLPVEKLDLQTGSKVFRRVVTSDRKIHFSDRKWRISTPEIHFRSKNKIFKPEVTCFCSIITSYEEMTFSNQEWCIYSMTSHPVDKLVP